MFCDKSLKTPGMLDVLNRALKSEFEEQSLRENNAAYYQATIDSLSLNDALHNRR